MRFALSASWLCGTLLAVVPVAAASASRVANGVRLELARNGGTDYVIAVRRNATPAESLAASELASYLGRISGARFTVRSLGAGAEHAIVVRRANAADGDLTGDAYAIRVRGDSLILAGGSDRAVLYAAYDLLERLGCEWIAPDLAFYHGAHEVVPHRQVLAYESAGDVIERPAIATRILDVGQAASYDTTSLRQLAAWLPKLRFNTVRFPADHGGSGRVMWDNWRAVIAPELTRRGLSIEVGGHGYQNYLGARMENGALFAAHPEWFGRDSTCRRSRATNVVFNSANGDAVRFLLGNAARYVRERPEISVFDFWPPDGARWAECAADSALGAPQERQVKLANALAGELRGVRPTAQLEIIAYADALLPPRSVTLDRDIIVDFCPIDQSFDAPIDDAGTRNNARYVAALREWRRAHPGQLGAYTYYRKYAWRSLPVLIPHYMQRDLRWYASVPVQRISTYAEPADWFTYELNYLAFGKLAWNPETDVDSLVARYVEARFGRAHEAAAAAIATLENEYRLRGSIPFSASDTPEELHHADVSLASRLASLNAALGIVSGEERANVERLARMVGMAQRDVRIQEARVRGDSPKAVAAQVDELVRFINAHADEGVFLSRGYEDDRGRYQRHYTRESVAVAPVMMAQRTRETINSGWLYHEGGVNFAESVNFPDATWQPVSLPHTWNAHDPFDDVPSYRRGIGWYRKHLRLADSLKGKRIFLAFEGANQVADVYVNGAFAGEHRGGYTAFTVDVTRLVRFDGKGNENVIAVQVNNAHDPSIPPLSVGYALYGGIYRDVWLVTTDPVHVTLTDHGGPGVYVSTPGLTKEQGTVVVRGSVANDGASARQLRIVSTVLDAAGAKVTQGTTALSVSGASGAEWSQKLPVIRAPHLWSPDDPYLYTVRTDVYDGAVLRDRVTNPLGFRWYHFDPRRGFFLNGEKFTIHGTNRHQDYAGLGSALSNDLHVRDMEWIKQMGANFVRLAHYPQDPAVLEAADRLGLLIWEEIPVVNYITPSPEFTHNAETMLREMIRQHYDHPSVIMWGTMNEVFLWSPEGARIRVQDDTAYMRYVRDYAAHMDSLARREDPTRVTTMATHMSGDYEKSGVTYVSQVLGLNIYDGWYSGTFDGFGIQLDKHHARMPDRVIFVSEYGAEDDYRVNSLEPERFDFSGTWMRRYHESYLRQMASRPWLGGTAIWNEFDFSQPETGGSIPYMNQKGMLTWDRKPKDVYYLYKANWNPAPMVYIASRGWARRTGTDSTRASGTGPGTSTQPVDVYSNLASVELFLNGRSLGRKSPDDVKRATWDVPFIDGDNVVIARGTRDGTTYDDRLAIHLTYRASQLADPSVPFHELGVNVGSKAQVADDAGLVWEGDQPYHAGGFGYTGGSAKMFNKDLAITGHALTPLFFTYREGIERFRLDVPDGAYDLELLLAEPGARAGERVFDVLVNGETMIGALDLAAQYGVARAATFTKRVVAGDGHGIVVTFRPLKGEPILNAIKVVRR